MSKPNNQRPQGTYSQHRSVAREATHSRTVGVGWGLCWVMPPSVWAPRSGWGWLLSGSRGSVAILGHVYLGAERDGGVRVFTGEEAVVTRGPSTGAA